MIILENIWSSFNNNAQSLSSGIIKNHPVYLTLGKTEEERQFVYRGLFQRYMDNDLIHQVRDAINHELVLGRTEFKDKMEKILNRQTRLGKAGRPCVKEINVIYYI